MGRRDWPLACSPATGWPVPPLSSASCSDHWRTFTCRPSYASQRVYAVDALVLTDQSRTALNRAGNILLVLGPLGPRVEWQNTRYMPGKPGMASSGTDLRKTICVCFMLGWLILWWTISDSAHFDYKTAHRRVPPLENRLSSPHFKATSTDEATPSWAS